MAGVERPDMSALVDEFVPAPNPEENLTVAFAPDDVVRHPTLQVLVDRGFKVDQSTLVKSMIESATCFRPEEFSAAVSRIENGSDWPELVRTAARENHAPALRILAARGARGCPGGFPSLNPSPETLAELLKLRRPHSSPCRHDWRDEIFDEPRRLVLLH
eukprot:scaffold367769_cov11-Prasinocladus_malaysianus.AAC.1